MNSMPGMSARELLISALRAQDSSSPLSMPIEEVAQTVLERNAAEVYSQLSHGLLRMAAKLPNDDEKKAGVLFVAESLHDITTPEDTGEVPIISEGS